MERLRPFENHPFKVKEDEAMARLMESIERYGIMNPLIVMPTTEGFYRIISGHRRKYCAEKLGYTQVPVIIRYMKEDDSIISRVDSNLHREKIRSRFGYSSTMDTRFCFVYQLSQKVMI
ncbi:ParB N-terminal domain-containing protein [Eubacterium ramulus]|uniref:ParB N-terminal domain-containing protein n=1 Tax=Eubacterium ramulus TaxID=39490 RepID=UPI0012B00AFC